MYVKTVHSLIVYQLIIQATTPDLLLIIKYWILVLLVWKLIMIGKYELYEFV